MYPQILLTRPFFTMPLVQGMTLDQIVSKLNREWKNDASTEFSTDQFVHNSPETPIVVGDSSSFSVPISELVKNNPSSGASSASFAYFQSVAKIGWQIASAIAYAHQRGVLHRDIKPANILLDAQGTVWISDFGLAKNVDEDSTMTGDLLGTLRYMAPERFEGQCDERSDIYGIGLVLFELATLSPAIERSDRLQTISTIRNQLLPEPRQIEPRIPIDLNTIISKAIEKEAKNRYTTAAGVAEDLGRFLNHEPILARKISTLRKTAMWCQRNPLATSLVTTIGLFLLVITLGSLRAAATLSVESKAAQLARDAAIESKVLSERSDWESRLIAIKAIRTSRRPGQRFETLKRARDLNSSPVPPGHHSSELRAEAFGALCNADLTSRLLWTIPSGQYLLCITDDFRLLVTADHEGTASVYDIESKEVLHKLPGKGTPTTYDGAAFSSDNRYLAIFFPNTSELDVWNTSGTKPQLSHSFCGILDYSFSPDASRLALLYREHRVEINRLPDGELIDRIDVPENGPMEWNPCFEQIAVGTQTIDLATHRITNQAVSALGRVNEIAWHPKGKQITYSVDEDKLITWDTELNCEVRPSVRLRSKGGSCRHIIARDLSCLQQTGRVLIRSTMPQRAIYCSEPMAGKVSFHFPKVIINSVSTQVPTISSCSILRRATKCELPTFISWHLMVHNCS